MPVRSPTDEHPPFVAESLDNTGQLLMAYLWTSTQPVSVHELQGALSQAGREISVRATVAALRTLQGQVERSGFLPFSLKRAESMYQLVARTECFSILSQQYSINLSDLTEDQNLIERMREVLGVVVYYSPEGISTNKVRDRLRVDPVTCIDLLAKADLIYSPAGTYTAWRVTMKFLWGFGYESLEDFPHYNEMRDMRKKVYTDE